MPNIKTAVSLDESLFAQADNLAKKLHISRSRFFSLLITYQFLNGLPPMHQGN